MNILAARQADLAGRFAGQAVYRRAGFQYRGLERMDGGDQVMFLEEVLGMRWRDGSAGLVPESLQGAEARRSTVHD